jgi:hypothetical protein
MTLQLHKPDGEGGLEARPATDQEWRSQLRSTRWGASLRKDSLPKLGNPEMDPTPSWISIGFWVGLGALTFILLVIGYGSGFWG